MPDKQNIVFQKQAQEDINEIAHYIAKDNLSAAEAFFDAVDACCEMLLHLPEMGSVPDTLILSSLKDTRMFPVKHFANYLIFYRPLAGKKIEVVRIVHGARDLPALFGNSVEGEGGEERKAA